MQKYCNRIIKVNGRVYIPLILNPITIILSAHKIRVIISFLRATQSHFAKILIQSHMLKFHKTSIFSTHSTSKL